MDQKPYHYDGSVQINYEKSEDLNNNIPFEMTEEMRKNIGRNQYAPEDQA
ncbi:hypothetical protein [Bacillus sp. J33]|nr:hypothetical protein [Bacillus sp. J33]